MKSYSASFGSANRASRVHATRRALSALKRVTALARSPRFVLVNPDGAHLAVDYGGAYDVRSTSGDVSFEGSRSYRGGLVLLDSGALIGGRERRWDGAWGAIALDTGLASSSDVAWAIDVDAESSRFVVLLGASTAPVRVPLDGGGVARAWDARPARMRIESERFFLPARINTATVWSEALEGRGCGAVGEGRWIATAMQDGRFVVFDANTAAPRHDGTGAGQHIVDAQIHLAAYDLSITEAGYVLLGAVNTSTRAAPMTSLARAFASEVRSWATQGSASPGWKTVVVHIDVRGHEVSRVEVPFEALQPPVDAGAGRVFVLGNGVAAFQDGKLLYAHPSLVPMLATAFEDGTLALSVGPELRLLSRDGAVLQTFTTEGREPITTPPAIAADGAVWVGTEKALYVAR